jgi:hypothetical protein
MVKCVAVTSLDALMHVVHTPCSKSKWRVAMLRFISVLGAMIFCACLVLAQGGRPRPETSGDKKSAVFDEQEWYFAKASGGVSDPSEDIYAGPSKEAAEEACRKWEMANKTKRPNWITTVSDPIKVKVPVVRPTVPRDRPKIEFQDPKFVDPGSTKTAAKPYLALKGKKAQGQIGELKVKFAFNDKDTVEITGDAIGTGQWNVEGTSLYMKTKVATFRGTVTEVGGAGLRLMRDSSEPPTPWSFRFDSDADSGKKADLKNVAGTYKYVAGGHTQTFTIDESGMVRIYAPPGSYGAGTYSGKLSHKEGDDYIFNALGRDWQVNIRDRQHLLIRDKGAGVSFPNYYFDMRWSPFAGQFFC